MKIVDKGSDASEIDRMDKHVDSIEPEKSKLSNNIDLVLDGEKGVSENKSKTKS